MKIDDVFNKLRPVWGRQLELLWQEYLVADPPLQKTIEKVLRVQLARQLGETFQSEQVLLRPPPEELATGQYPAGTIYYGKDRYYEFGLREEEFIQHIGIFGRSGSGKTNLAFLILKGLAEKNKPFLVFDWKRNYRDLLTAPEFSDMLVFTVGRDVSIFRFNPLIPPPGTPAKVWLKKLIEIMCHAYFLGEGVSVLLLRAIDSLYRDCGLYSGKLKGYPTMSHVQKWLAAYGAKGRERGWMESAIRAVETLCFGEVGNVLNSEPFMNISMLLEKQAVLELDALTNADKTFLIEALLLWIHHYRLAEGKREQFKHAVIIEEAHHILLRKKQEVTGEETVTDVLLREIRELGVSIICLDQHPSLISKPALGNTYTTFAFNLKHRGDLAMIQDCLLLDKEQTGYLGRLEVGWSAVKLQGRWFWPFLIKVPLVKLKKGVITDARLKEIIKERQTELFRLQSRALSFSGAFLAQDGILSPGNTQDKEILPFRNKGKREKMSDKSEKCAIRLTTQEKDLLMDVWRYPTSSVAERYKRMSFSAWSGNKLVNLLINRDFISYFFIILNRGRKKILTLTEEGREALGIKPDKSDRHGSPEHRYWLKRIEDQLKTSGYNVAKEVPIGGGKTIDLVATHDSKRVAIEIETGKSDALANIRKCIDAGFNRVVVVATSARVRDKLPDILSMNNEIEVLTASEALKRNRL